MAGQELYIWQTPAFSARLSLATVHKMNTALGEPNIRDEELGGILLGRMVADHSVEITGFEFFVSGHRRGIAYDLGPRERTRLTAQVQRLRVSKNNKGEIPVGYFRTHHRPGLFLDQDDFAVMTDAFADPSCTALLIRPDRSGVPAAGFFFWENEDIDRTRTQLPFPFDAQLLRERGPVMTVPTTDSRILRRLIPAWQAMAMAAFAAAAGFGIVSASTRYTQLHPKVLAAISLEPESAADDMVPAEPDRYVVPHVPDSLAASLSGEVPVDVLVSIDRRGVVRNAEVLNGGGTGFDALAADNATHTRWRPAHQGDRNVAGERVVHYRFTPASAGRQ